MKKASELVDYCKKQVGRPYWNGGIGQMASIGLYKQNKDRLNYGDWSIYADDVGKKVHDCNGLVKAFFWTDNADAFLKVGQYQSNGCGDWSVEEMYNQCPEKGDIGTMPKLPGVLLFTSNFSHMGVYVGDGKVVEARGTGKGVQLNYLSARGTFTKWGKLSRLIEYDMLAETPKKPRKKVMDFQKWLNAVYGKELERVLGHRLAEDGYYGAETRRGAIIAMQIALNSMGEKLVVDGWFGKASKAAMSRHMVIKVCRDYRAYIVQGLLYCVGLDPNGFDGSFNNGAEKATKIFQERFWKGDADMVDGKVGGETFGKLVE